MDAITLKLLEAYKGTMEVTALSKYSVSIARENTVFKAYFTTVSDAKAFLKEEEGNKALQGSEYD